MIPHHRTPVLITGGAGFIGTNLADRLLSDGHTVLLLDNLSRAGVRRNLTWLVERHGRAVERFIGDVRDAATVRRAVRAAGTVFHLAAQVAVTTSLEAPLDDFETNARGTLNVLEAIRESGNRTPILYTSTNKVYGTLSGLEVAMVSGRYAPADPALRASGISEAQPLDFHSPYGCSKGAADQYVLDYARVFAIPAVVFRMSCIYGPHQCGNEDQGWVAHFLLRALAGAPITIFGDGRQVRDALYVDDLVEAMLRAIRRIEATNGRAFNLGGGPANAVSLLELLEMVRQVHGAVPDIDFQDWRPADQRYYVSDTSAFEAATGWRAEVGVPEGVARLYHALRATTPSAHEGVTLAATGT